MASELQTDYISAKNIYFILRNSVGQAWNGSAFENYATANLATYKIAATEQGTASGYYAANMPAAAAGVYYAVAKEQAGGSAAESDITIGTGSLRWDGTTVPLGLPSRITKNTALANFEFFMADSTDHVTGKTGLTVTATRSIDGGAFAACANSVVEVSNGMYKINLAASDLNGDTITLRFTGTGADARLVSIVTQVG